jgi:hypothetical protein
MRKLRFAVLLIAVAAGAGHAAAGEPRVKKYYIPPARSAAPKPAPKGSAAPPGGGAAPVLSSRLAGPQGLSRPLLQSGLQRGLPGLPAVGDTTPQCRSACAQTRFVCLSTDGDTCDQQWGVCLAGCRS